MKNKFIYLLMIPVLFLSACEEDCEHLNYLGQDVSIAKFTLNKGTSEYPLKIYKDSLVFSVGAGFDFSGLAASVTLSEGAVISPLPSTITDWSKNATFTVTAIDQKTTTQYEYIVHTGIYEKVYAEVASLTTQAEVNAFGAEGYTRVAGIRINSVEDAEEQITDLSALNTIETIDYGVHITGFYGKDMNGFQNLKKLTTFEISNITVETLVLDNLEEATNLLIGKLYENPMVAMCPALKTVSFAKLRIVHNDLALCGGMTSFEGLSNLESIGGEVVIQGRNENMKGFEKITKLNYLTIGSQQLTSLEGLHNLKEIKKSLKIAFVGLETLDGLNIEVLGNLNINNASKIQDITALHKITKLGSLFISGLPRLSSLEGLHNVKTINDGITLSYVGQGTMSDPNSGLKDLNGLRSLESLNGVLTIRQCTKLEDISALEKLTRCGNLEILGSPLLTSLMGLHNITAIDGNLLLDGLGKRGWGSTPSTGVSNLDGLAGVKKIGGSISIKNCYNLTDFCAVSEVLGKTLALVTLTGNAYNPSIADLQAGKCSK